MLATLRPSFIQTWECGLQWPKTSLKKKGRNRQFEQHILTLLLIIRVKAKVCNCNSVASLVPPFPSLSSSRCLQLPWLCCSLNTPSFLLSLEQPSPKTRGSLPLALPGCSLCPTPFLTPGCLLHLTFFGFECFLCIVFPFMGMQASGTQRGLLSAVAFTVTEA